MGTVLISILRLYNFCRITYIIVIALPAYTSHRIQVLHYAIFSSFKTYLRNTLNESVLTTSGAERNDVYTLWELVHDACI